MRRRGRRASIVAAAALAATAAAPAGVAAARAATPAVAHGGFALVQYAQGAGTDPWAARLLSTTDPATTTASAPRAAPDSDGGTQVTFRNPSGDAIWLDGSGTGRYESVDLTAVTGIAPLEGAPVPFVSPHGLDEVAAITTSGHLLVLTWNPYRRVPEGPGGTVPPQELWVATDLTTAGGPLLTGAPSVVTASGVTSVFARTAAGHLVEYANDGARGRAWNAYDLTAIAGAPAIASDPAAFYDPTTEQVRVAATELAPHRGDVVVYTPDDVGGRVWTADDVTAATGSAPLASGVDALVYGGRPTVVGATAAGDLLELSGADEGLETGWTATDVTTETPGSPAIAGTPSASVSGSRLTVAAVAASWGDLFDWTSVTPGGTFSVADLSTSGVGTVRTVAGSPAAVFVGGALSVFTAGAAVPPPEGTGVYAAPDAKWAKAITDGWPVLGVTGGLGARCAPWTAPPGTAAVDQPDEQMGLVIQASHVRETWLSFWTVSGPGTAPSSQCQAEKGPITSRTYYLHGYLAGREVATLIDAYQADGLGLKPDWVIFDPEGYPDNHSGLWGPTAPPSKLAQSVANWYAMLSGWHNGITAVDPSLKPALYANQYEYMTYELYGQPLPTFIAGAFGETTTGGKQQLQVPLRTAFGPNILGFVMYNDFTPTCAQVTDERLLLEAAPWSGDYNTLQLPAGAYCPPGQAPNGRGRGLAR